MAKIEGLGGAARLETLMAGPPADLPGLKKKPDADAGWSAAAVVVSASPVTGEDDKAEGEKTQARAQARGRASRAHELLTLRAREVFAAAACDENENETATKTKAATKAHSVGSKRRVLAAVYALVSWLDNLHDVFVSPDPGNFGRIFAPDPHAGGALVPSRLLGGP